MLWDDVMQFLIPVWLCRHPCRVWETAKRTTRQANTEADGDGRLPSVFCPGAVFRVGHNLPCAAPLRRGNHRPAQANAAQRLRCHGEAVPPSFGMLHSGVSCRSNTFVIYKLPTLPVIFSLDLRVHDILCLGLRLDWWGWKCRDYSTEGAQGRNRIQGGSGRGDPRYHGLHYVSLSAAASTLSLCSGGVQELHPEIHALFMWMTVTCLDPGLSNCTTQIVLVNINGDEAENINPTQQLGK